MIDGDHEAGSARSWYAVAVLSVIYAVAIIDRLIIPISIQQVRHSLQLNDFQISLMIGFAFATFYSLCGLPIGLLVDRFSRRAIIAGGMLIWSVAAIASGLSRTPAELFVSRMLVGAGEAALSPAAYSILSDLFAKDRLAAPISLFVTGGTLGSAAALAVGGLLLQYFTIHGGLTLPHFGVLLPWQSLFVCAGLPGLACLPLIASLPEPRRRMRRAAAHLSPDEALVGFLGRRRGLFTLLFIGFGAAAMLPYGYQAWIPALMMRSFSADPATAGRAFGLIVALCGLAAHGCNGFVVDGLFRRGLKDAHLTYFVVTALVASPVVVLAFLSDNWSLLMIGIVLAHLLLTPFVGYAGAALQIITPPQMRGRISALYLFMISAIGLGLGPSLVALIGALVFHSDAKLGPALAIFTLLCTVPAVIALLIARRSFRRAVTAAE